MKERIVVAMSGGVDSSVAAALLKEQGHEVIGATMYFNLADYYGKKLIYRDLNSLDEARKVARKLRIEHYAFDVQGAFNDRVIKHFCREYSLGRTPNPCVRCNQYIKFGVLLGKAFSLGANYLATGHYARIIKAPSSHLQTPSYILKKAKDLDKDQSYFLYRLNQSQLEHILFPLGNYTKNEVRNLARRFCLSVAEKKASQEICFLQGQDYRGFLKEAIKEEIRPGPIIDKQGSILGQHQGVAFYTLGQRQGLGIAKGYPLYITTIDYKNNRVVVGSKEEASKKEFLVKEPHFILEPIKKKVALKVRIRYNHKEAVAQISPYGSKIKVRFKEPQFAVTPGQSAVFYKNNTVQGGGIIERILI